MLEDKLRQQDQQTAIYQRTIATRITLITFALMLMVAIVNAFFISNEDKTFIDNYAMPFIALSAGLSFYLARKGDHIRGIYLLLGSIALTALIYPFAADNVGWQAAIGMLVITTGIANSTLSSRAAGRISAMAFLLAIMIILLELFVSGLTHLPITTSSIVITTVLSVIYAGIILSRFRMFSVRTKLITAFIAVSMVSVGAVAFTISRSILGQLTAKVDQEVTGVARLSASSIAAQLDKQVDLLRTLALSRTLYDELTKINATATSNRTELEQLDRQWQAAGNGATPLVQSVLTHAFSEELREFHNTFPEYLEVLITDRYGANVAATNHTSHYYQADEEWWQTAYNDGRGRVFVSQPEFDQSSQTIVFLIALPVVDPEARQVVGILSTTVDFKVFTPAFEAGRFGQTGRTEIYLPNGEELEIEKKGTGEYELKVDAAPADFSLALQQDRAFMDTTHDGIPVLSGQASLLRADEDPEDVVGLQRLGWQVVTLQDRTEALRLVTSATRNAQLVGLAALLMAGLLAAGVAQVLTRPIVRLTRVAEKVLTGDLQTRAQVESSDEIGVLADSFNRMTSRLTDTLGSLERRVAERTADLEMARLLSERRAQELHSVSEISRLISSEQRLDLLLPLITRLVGERFDYYHIGIFFVDTTHQFAILQAANSEGGQRMLTRRHRLEAGPTSIVGSVADTGKARIALDVGPDAVFFDNPDLPNTRSEMALPLNIRKETIGVLDVQSTKPGAFAENDANILGILADQVAIAIENARLFGQTQKAFNEVQSLYTQFLQQEWLAFGRQESRIGYHQSIIGGRALEAPIESDEIYKVLHGGEVIVLDGRNDRAHPSLSVPVKLRGQTIGVLNIKSPTQNRRWSQDEINLAQVISDRLALALDNARLLQESQRRAAKEAKIGEVTAKIGASINIRNVLQTAVEELGRALPGSEVVIQFEQNESKKG
jgi:GAF domain-containing protein/HAMP domain-containing protein